MQALIISSYCGYIEITKVDLSLTRISYENITFSLVLEVLRLR